jgi:hypothetical protein
MAAPSPDHGPQAAKTVKKVEKEKKVKKVKVQKAKQTKVQKVKVQKQKTVKQVRVVQAAPQQQIVIRRTAPRTVYVQPAQVQYRRGTPSAGENSPLFAVEGYLTDEGRRCLALRDRRGNLYTLVGKTEGLEIGDHVSLMVRRVLPVYARECGQGDTVRVGQVRAIWSDRSYDSPIYDSRNDGTFDPYQRNRYEQRDRYRDRDRYGRYDDRYDDRRYDSRDDDGRYYDVYDRDYRGDNGRLISVTGRLGGDRDCASLRDRDGRLFGLSGDLRQYEPGDTVRVIGFLQGGSRCGGTNIDVQEVTRP